MCVPKKFNRRAKPFSKTTDSARSQPTTRNKCTRCCKGLHSRQGCPAKEATCHRCKKGTTSPSVFPTYRRSPDSSVEFEDASFLDAVTDKTGSTSLSETEKRYSQIEEEALALVWTCEKFADYIIGKQIQIETDHKPLVPLLGTTQRDSLPPRVLRFQLRLTRFDYLIAHVPGMYFYTADTLSRALIKSVDAYMRMTKMSRDSSKRSWNNYQQVRREWNSSVRHRKMILFAQLHQVYPERMAGETYNKRNFKKYWGELSYSLNMRF